MDMQVTTERLDNCQVKVVIAVEAAEIDKKLRQVSRRISRQFNVPGYRKGRAPLHAVMRVFGREAIQQEALDDFGNDLYEQAMDELEYEPYDVGKLEEVEWDPFRMIVMLPIQPEVELGDYRAVRVPLEPEPVTDEAIEERLAEYQQEHTHWVPVERPAALDDQVVVDFEGQVDDELVMKNDEYEMVLEAGSSLPMAGFSEAVVGLSAGEEKTFSLTVPEDGFDEEFVGLEAAVTVQLHTVREKDEPALDDELAMMIGDYDSLDELRAALREEMETAALETAEAEYLDEVLAAMIEAADKIEYPEQAIDREAEMMMARMEQNLASSGMDLDRFLAMMGKTRDMYRQELHPTAEEQLKKRLVLNKVAELERLTIEDKEVEAEIDRLREMAGPEEEGQLATMLQSEQGRLAVKDDLLMAEVQERIEAIGLGEAPPLAEETDGAIEEEGAEKEPVPNAETEADTEAEADPEEEAAD